MTLLYLIGVVVALCTFDPGPNPWRDGDVGIWRAIGWPGYAFCFLWHLTFAHGGRIVGT